MIHIHGFLKLCGITFLAVKTFMKIYLPCKCQFSGGGAGEHKQLSSVFRVEERECSQEMRYKQNEPGAKVQQAKESEAR